MTRKHAICIFFNEEFTNENSQRFEEDLENLCGLEICYAEDPYKPMLQTKVKVNGCPSYYHRYKDDLPKSTNNQGQISILLYINQTTLLHNQRQLIQYLKKVYRAVQLVDSDMYEEKELSMKQIYSETVVITDLFDEKSLRSFSTWCSSVKLDLMLAEQTRKIQKNDFSKTKIQHRSIWVLKDIHRESVAMQTLNVRTTHQARMHGLICEGSKIIGYVRKSPGKESTTTRLRLLDSMRDRLMTVSSVDMVFGSYNSASDDLFVKRDTNNPP
ncbi:hypothetical protein CLU79DRAFT_817658, partial [Phycomyces nitens]